MKKEISIDNLLFLRVFALCMVVLRHSFAPFTGAWGLFSSFKQNYFVVVLGEYVSSISMPLYVFISGVLFSYLRNKLNKYQTLDVLIQKKTKRLLVPYIIFAPLYIIFFMTYDNISDFIFYFWKGAGHLWFLTMIFVVFIVFYLFEKKFKKYPIKSFIIITLIFCLFPIYNYLRLGPIAKALYYFPFFYFGYFFHYRSSKILEFLSGKTNILILIHSCIFLSTIIINSQIDNVLVNSIFNAYMKLPLGLLSVSFIFMTFSTIPKSNNKVLNNFLTNISDKSYYIYIFHQPLMMVLYSWPLLVNKTPFLVIPTSFLVILLLSFLLGKIMMSFRYGRKLIGA